VTTRVYAGIGSRETPDDVRHLMHILAVKLRRERWTLRSGGAPGADTAFEAGATEDGGYQWAEIYLPWPGFEDRLTQQVRLVRPTQAAYKVAEQFHPAWERLSEGARALQARNVHQVLGPDVKNPVLSKFVICWTRDGNGAGGTGQAVRIARAHSIPVYDLQRANVRAKLETWLTGDILQAH
jgi:hypothetical protein